ncbi:MarP family serine protease [Actinomarinicola tropica]|uniref:MarP family serine protease n=1 Tax=Actinomarinicola tropica TaxID=2789776 RepID=A0A5Q2RK51_9ACTN|nr:MarP family serine protease [Actinomarinicola tropica]QGG95302.1 MarP family serine protease [Actinomarinicola tropica]
MPNLFDLLIVLGVAAAASAGWRLGFLTRVASWLGAGAGLLVALRALPWVVDRIEGAGALRLALTGGGVIVAGVSIGSLLGLVVGNRLRSAVSGEALNPVDRAAGAIVGGLGVLVAVWLLVPLMTNFSDVPAEQARTSRIARAIEDVFPPPPDGVQALRRVIGADQFPRVWNALHPTPDLVAPPTATGLDEEAAAAVRRSVVRVEGTACRRIQLGSGFVAAEGLVVTNAHVVAGQDDTSVVRDDGESLDATVVHFDPATDVAILRVPGLDRPALALVEGEVGDVGGVFGHPNGGDLRIAPFELARRVTATGTDIYDRDRVERDVLFVATELSPGDSGAALVDGDGEVVGLAFAIAPDTDGVAYALSTPQVVAALDAAGPDAVATDGCLH